jgi:hypothetical protein
MPAGHPADGGSMIISGVKINVDSAVISVDRITAKEDSLQTPKKP